MCKRCKERDKDGAWREWAGSKPQCAFKRGVFTGDNWNCATMNELRLIADDRLQTCNRHNDCSFGYVPVGNGRYIAMSWYKQRGTVGQAVTMFLDEPPAPLTLKIAEQAIAYCL